MISSLYKEGIGVLADARLAVPSPKSSAEVAAKIAAVSAAARAVASAQKGVERAEGDLADAERVAESAKRDAVLSGMLAVRRGNDLAATAVSGDSKVRWAAENVVKEAILSGAEALAAAGVSSKDVREIAPVLQGKKQVPAKVAVKSAVATEKAKVAASEKRSADDVVEEKQAACVAAQALLDSVVKDFDCALAGAKNAVAEECNSASTSEAVASAEAHAAQVEDITSQKGAPEPTAKPDAVLEDGDLFTDELLWT